MTDAPRSAEILTRDVLERDILGFQVSEFPNRYVEALTHANAAKELGVPSYERLEFLGDSILSFTIAKHLFETWPDESEGFLSKLRTKLTCSATLANFGRALGLQKYVTMTAADFEAGRHLIDATIEDAFEALVAAIYMDRGLVVARTFILRLVGMVDRDSLLAENNFKDVIRKYVKSKSMQHEIYDVQKVPAFSGDGAVVFDCVLTIPGIGPVGRAVDAVKKRAEMKAAKVACIQLRLLNSSSS